MFDRLSRIGGAVRFSAREGSGVFSTLGPVGRLAAIAGVFQRP